MKNMMNKYPENPSTNEIFTLTKEASDNSKDRREAKKSQENMRFAKSIATLSAIAIAGPFAAYAADRAIEQPQKQSAENARKVMDANPAVANNFKTNDGKIATVKR